MRWRPKIARKLLLASLAGLVLLCFDAGGGGPALATHNSVTVSVGIDADPAAVPANSALSLGSIESCRSVSNGATFTIDFFVKLVTSPGIEAFQGDINYDASRLKVTAYSVSMMLAANAGSSVTDFTNANGSDTLPDTDGVYTPIAFDFSMAGGHTETGSGVLARVTLQAIATGTASLTLTTVKLADPSFNPIGDLDSDGIFDGDIANAQVVIGGACLPNDSDGDGVPDVSDNCPVTANPLQENNDAPAGPFGGTQAWIADGVGSEGATTGGDACDTNDDNDKCLDTQEATLTPPRNPLNPWDFAAMWVPALPAAGSPTGGRDGSVGIPEVIAIISWVGAANDGAPNGTGRDYDSDVNANGVEDGAEYDRTPGVGISGPPSGAVGITDALVVLAQAGDVCVPP